MIKSCLFSSIAGIILSSVLVSGCVGAVTTEPSPKAPSAPAVKEAARAEWEIRWEKVVAGAKQEGKVVLYGEGGPTFQRNLTQAFKEKYGIDVEILPGKGSEVAQKYLMERSANLTVADVLMTGQTTTLTSVKPKGVLTSPKPHLILPEVLDAKVWPGGVLPFLDKDEMALALLAGASPSVAVNTEQVKEGEIRSYNDFLNPKWKGKITWYDPSISGNGSTVLAIILLKVFGREAGEKYLRELAKQDLAITRDVRLHAETVARGKYAVAIGPSPQAITDLIKAGAPVAWPRMEKGRLISTGAFVLALPDKLTHPNAAAVLLNYMLTKDGQLIASEAAGRPPRRLDVSTKYADPPDSVPQPGDAWLDEEFVLTEPTLHPLAREIFGQR